MSFDAQEISNFDGVPIGLYEFWIEDKFWRYTTFEHDVTAAIAPAGTGVYSALAISDSGVTQTGDTNNDDLTITLPKSADVMRPWIGTPPSSETWLRIRRKDANDAQAVVVWIGTITNAKIVDSISAEMVGRMLTASFIRNGLRSTYQRGCRAALYDNMCKVNKSEFAVSGTIDSVGGGGIAVSEADALPDGYFSGGFIQWTNDDGLTNRRAIEWHAGPTLALLELTDGLTTGQAVTIYPGCDRTTATCENKFNNLANYRGFPHLPGKSPYDGDPVF